MMFIINTILYPIGWALNKFRDWKERTFFTGETVREQLERRNREIFDSDKRYVYTKKEGGRWHRGELGQFDLWGEVVHKYPSMVTEAGTRYDSHIKTRKENWCTRKRFEQMWKGAV